MAEIEASEEDASSGSVGSNGLPPPSTHPPLLATKPTSGQFSEYMGVTSPHFSVEGPAFARPSG